MGARNVERLRAAREMHCLWPEEQPDMKTFVAIFVAVCSLAFASSAFAGTPKIDASCSTYPVLTTLHVASQYSSLARDRLTALAQMTQSARKAAWNSGHEGKWLGKFSEGRFEVAWQIATGAASVLKSSNLTVECDVHIDAWGRAGPGTQTVYLIELGRPWLHGLLGKSTAQLAGERQLTMIHEAAHHGGANRGELLGRIGVKDALKRASLLPGTAVRTAENHALYALCRASNSIVCTPAP
jgi:hypothetical protein